MITLDAFEKRLNAEGINLTDVCLGIKGDVFHVYSHHDSGLRLWIGASPQLLYSVGQTRLTKKMWEVIGLVSNRLVKRTALVPKNSSGEDKLVIALRLAPPALRRRPREITPVFN